MLIFGHHLIKTESFALFTDKIHKNKINFIKTYDESLIKLLQKSEEKWAICVRQKDELFLANALGADFILLDDEKLASFASKVAEFYLFDSKILLLVTELKNLHKAYELGVDGVLLKDLLA
ncbi:hypothetical protein [Campylobacter avium]|uniref:hypothetical protein n=1 Tax=Campylobacter avium TaxID=522485 RepID=UPI00255B8F6E|nr:hypothetical protein [Campylobacter avium]